MFGNLDMDSIIGGIQDAVENMEGGIFDKIKENLELLADSKVYQLQDGELLSMEVTLTEVIEGALHRVPRPLEEYIGWKLLEVDVSPTPTVYQNIVTYYEEDSSTIYQKYRLETKNVAEIVAINTKFWSENYIKINYLDGTHCYVPYCSTMNGETYRILQDDLPMIMLGVMTTNIQLEAINNNTSLTDEQKAQAIESFLSSPGVVSYLSVYGEPDHSQELTSEYIESLLITERDMGKITTIIQHLAGLLYTGRKVPSVL